MPWYSITEVSRSTGLTARALRHYESLGLVTAERQPNGYREYNDEALLTLQRILVLRELGLGLTETAEILSQPTQASEALRRHAAALREQRNRIDRQIAAVERSSIAIELGEPLMTADPFDGFDHTEYRDEVIEQWGEDTWKQSDRWWREMSEDARASWKQRVTQLGADWVAAANAGEDPAGSVAQALAARHADWLRGVPGAPTGPDTMPDYLRGLGEMYVADERFAANYGGVDGARFVRDALTVYADTLTAER